MAHVTYKQDAFVSRELGAAYLRRMMGAVRLQLRHLALDLDATGRELRVAHDLRDLDLRLLRDIGVERDAC